MKNSVWLGLGVVYSNEGCIGVGILVDIGDLMKVLVWLYGHR